MATTGKSFRAPESVASLFRHVLGRQFPNHAFTFELLPYHERGGTYYYDIHMEASPCPEEVRAFIDDYLTRLFPTRS